MKDISDMNDQITLTLEDDTDLLCDVIATFPAKYNGEENMYIALLPVDADEDAEIYLYRFIENGDDIDVLNIEDDEEFEIVSDAFDELQDEQEFYDLMDDDEEE